MARQDGAGSAQAGRRALTVAAAAERVAVEPEQLRRMWLLQDASERELVALAARCEQRAYPAGAAVGRQGEPSDGVYFVASGAVDVFAPPAVGSRLLTRLGPGESLGEMGVVDGEPRSATAVAARRTVCYFVPEDPFCELLDRAPRVTQRLLMLLCQRLRRRDRPPDGPALRQLRARP
jgi:CRP-like cAMP-binding protein